MFGRLMNSYYYGKSGKGDYRKEDLPKNRWQLFWEMLRVRLSGICRVNLMTCILWIPMMLVIMSLLINPIISANDIMPVADEATGNSYIALVYDPVTNEAGEVVSEGLITPLSGVMSTFFLFLFPCILITGPAQAGMAYVMRNWARDEHAFPWSDFKDAVKDNWKQALGISAITGLLPYIVYVAYNFFSAMAKLALPNLSRDREWYLVADTSRVEQVFLEDLCVVNESSVMMNPQSICIFVSKKVAADKGAKARRKTKADKTTTDKTTADIEVSEKEVSHESMGTS